MKAILALVSLGVVVVQAKSIDLFAYLDTNGDNFLDKSELVAAEDKYFEYINQHISQVMSQVDSDGNHKVSLKEIMDASKTKVRSFT